MFRADTDGMDQVDQLQRKVREGVSRLKGIEIGEELSVEILAQLIENKKNKTEIVEGIYGLSRSDEGFKSSFTRVGRELKKLESKGLVSRKVFGRDRPYRLTQLAITNLARIGGDEQQVSLVPWFDVVVYLATLVMTLPVALQSIGWINLPKIPTIGLSGFLCIFLGMSISEMIRMVRKVF